MFSYSGAPSSRGLDQRLYGLRGVGNVPGGVWVVLELEWGLRLPPAEFCRDHLTSPQPHPLLLLFFWLLRQHGGFLLLVQPHHHLSLLLGSGLFFGSDGGCLACCSFVFRML